MKQLKLIFITCKCFCRLTEVASRNYFRQACAGLDYLHYHNVVHGDL